MTGIRLTKQNQNPGIGQDFGFASAANTTPPTANTSFQEPKNFLSCRKGAQHHRLYSGPLSRFSGLPSPLLLSVVVLKVKSLNSPAALQSHIWGSTKARYGLRTMEHRGEISRCHSPPALESGGEWRTAAVEVEQLAAAWLATAADSALLSPKPKSN
ncbi:hypothetical protein GX48_00013 [Paracoccidioides brasiliensis]|nr:hypothetical protein GX48_00013 [Paracoccidioides brasiliensis]